MKNSHFASILSLAFSGLILLGTAQACAYTKQAFTDTFGPLADQMDRAATFKDPSCPQNYTQIFGHDNVKISVFYGYENFDEDTVDKIQSEAMVYALTRPCLPNLGACDFKIIGKKKNFTQLQKTINGKNVILSVYSTSLTENDTNNRSQKNLYWLQEAFSTQVRNQFYNDIVQSDVVFYMGHSRIGAGLGFNSQSWIEEGVNYVFRMPMMPIIKALASRPSHLKLFGLFACSSDPYYKSEIERANPGVSLILSKDEVMYDEGPQALMGGLNSLLAQKCDREFHKSMITTSNPKHDVMEFIRKTH